jgi:hypothetical protein
MDYILKPLKIISSMEHPNIANIDAIFYSDPTLFDDKETFTYE